MIHTSYLSNVFTTTLFSKTVNRIVCFLRPYKEEFFGLAVQGMSGALVGGAVASRLEVPIALVRKNGDDNHSGLSVEGDANIRKYVIIDDCICEGGTVNNIRHKMSAFNKSTLIGIILYNATYNDKDIVKSEATRFNCWIKQFNARHNSFYPRIVRP